jgi:beta-lactamase regulating signal transducer with metallopeptidase domain
MSFGLADWLLTYLAHSTALLAAAWLAGRAISERRLVLREAIWRLALLGGLVTATLQLATGVESVVGSWSLAESRAPAVQTAARSGARAPAGIANTTRPQPAPAPAATTRPVSSRPWGLWLTTLWAIGAGTLLGLLAFSYARFRRRLRGRRDLVEGELPARLRRLERAAGDGPLQLPPVRLTSTRRIGVALARGVRKPEICLPEETLEQLSIEHHEIVLAHELAHLRRRDPVWFALTRILERLLFFQPLNGLARRQLQEISEFRCDDWAVEVTRRPISLAKCLTQVAESNLDSEIAVLAPTMSATKTNLGRRVARLLERNYPMPSDRLPRWLAPAALALLVLTVLIAPGIRASAAPALDPAAPRLVAPAPPPPAEVDAAPKAAPQPPATPKPAPAPKSGPLPAPTPRADSAPSPPTPPSPATVPSPPKAPSPALAPRTLHVHEDDWVVADGDLALAFDEFATLAAELEVDIAPVMRAVEESVLATEASTEWVEALEFDQERLEGLRELTERLEGVGFATEAETARLAEMAERLIETAEPNAERMQELRERAQEMMELEQETLARHLERARVFEESHRAEIERLRAETRRALEEAAQERRELVERSRQARQEARLGLERERHGELREEMLRMRHELREQLQMLEEELARDGSEGTADRAPEDKQ